jgi:predicted nuclease of predicted toxin-antitoxin system
MKLLLDEHVPRAVAVGLRRRFPEIAVYAITDWEKGRLRGKPDGEVLMAAIAGGLTLVTYDLRTIPMLLTEWGLEGRDHCGVIFCDARTIPQYAVGRLVKQIAKLYEAFRDDDWMNRVEFLEKE